MSERAKRPYDPYADEELPGRLFASEEPVVWLNAPGGAPLRPERDLAHELGRLSGDVDGVCVDPMLSELWDFYAEAGVGDDDEA